MVLTCLSIANEVSIANTLKWMVSKKHLKNIAFLHMDRRTYVSLSVCLSVCPWEKVASTLDYYPSWTEWAKQMYWSERYQKGHKNFHLFAYGWEGVCLSVCLSVRIKKLNNFWWNERILMKFSGPVELLTYHFCHGFKIGWPPGYRVAFLFKIYLLP